ncbi:hypothetical protein FACS189498_3740 [Spirochaetia bacterium]|nr:hypothetical protein FACS189498_3740 [Spirochaetia bacterium]
MHGALLQPVPEDIPDIKITCQHHKEKRAEYKEELEITPGFFHCPDSTTLR